MADEKKYDSEKFDIGVLGQGPSKGNIKLRNSGASEKKHNLPVKKIEDKKESSEALNNIIGRKVEKKEFQAPRRTHDNSVTKPTTDKVLSPSELVKETEKIAKEMLKEGKHRR